MGIEIRRIETEREIGEFIDFRTRLYRDAPCAVPYLHVDEGKTLRADRNPAFAFCEAEYYMAYRDGRAVGRVAAIINHKANARWGRRSVRFGFFDFVDDAEVSSALMERVRAFGRERGMDHVIGPMGFIDLDREGMLVEGFDVMGSMHTNYNFPYYPRHMERMGFVKDNDWVQELMEVPREVPERFRKITRMIGERYHLRARKLTKRQLLEGGYGRRLFGLLNECYAGLYEYSELDERQIDNVLKSYIGFADLNLVSFIFDESKEDCLVGFGITFPSFSEALRRTKNGRLLPFGWLHLARTLWLHDTDTVELMLVGVLPEYRAKGANAVLFDDLIGWYNKYKFKWAMTLPMMETNDGVLSAWEHFDGHVVKRMRSYRAEL